MYIASFLCYSHTQNAGFNIFAGALLGVCAGILWTAQAAIMLAYPPEDSKGRYISWFWMIFNLGGVIGALVCSIPIVRRPAFTNTTPRSRSVRTSTPKAERPPSPMVPTSAS